MLIQKRLLMGLAAFFLGSTICVFAAERPSNLTVTNPVGYWKINDEITGQAKSIVHISQGNNQLLNAKVIKIFSSYNASQNTICTACQGENHNQPIIGMVIMSGLQQVDKEWIDGNILDPKNGKTYKCSVRLTDKGKKLYVRKFSRLALFGHLQTWERVDFNAG